MKANLMTLILCSTLSLSSVAKTDEITLPVIQAPSALQEGVQRVLTQDQIDELLPWAQNSKIFLSDLLDNTQSLSSADKVVTLIEGITQVVQDSGSKNTETFMRYSLNRGLVISEILNKETEHDAIGTTDAKLRVLIMSIKLAIKYYDIDMKVMSKKTEAPYVAYGIDYYTFLTELNKSVFDASAQYSIQRTSLEWLQWDLYRDLNNKSYANQIVKINNGLKIFPTRKLSDGQSIAFIRQMKNLASQLTLSVLPGTQIGQAGSRSSDGAIKFNSKENPDGSVTINNLSYKRGDMVYDLKLGSADDYTSLCKALGFGRSLPYSGLSSYDTVSATSMVELTLNGSFSRIVSSSYKLTQSTCAASTPLKVVINSNRVQNDDGSVKFTNLKYLSGDAEYSLALSSADDYTNACKALGFNSALADTGLVSYETVSAKTMVVINSYGNFEKMSNGSYEISKLTCK